MAALNAGGMGLVLPSESDDELTVPRALQGTAGDKLGNRAARDKARDRAAEVDKSDNRRSLILPLPHPLPTHLNVLVKSASSSYKAFINPTTSSRS